MLRMKFDSIIVQRVSKHWSKMRKSSVRAFCPFLTKSLHVFFCFLSSGSRKTGFFGKIQKSAGRWKKYASCSKEQTSHAEIFLLDAKSNSSCLYEHSTLRSVCQEYAFWSWSTLFNIHLWYIQTRLGLGLCLAYHPFLTFCSPDFSIFRSKFECNTTSDWLNRMV